MQYVEPLTAKPDLRTQAVEVWDRVAPYSKPVLAVAARRPRMLFGLGALGLIGALAWMNRERIARTAGPLIDTCMERGANLYDRMPWKARAEDETDPTLLH